MARRQKRVIQIVVGTSLNGKITDRAGDFQKYSSPEDQVFLRKKIKESDVLIMGRKTFEKHVKRAGSRPIIVFSKKRTLCHLDPSTALRASRVRRGGRVERSRIFHGTKQDFLKLLNQFDYRKVTVLGGAEIYHWFMQKCLVTDLFITVEPYIFGAGKNFLQGGLLKPMPSFRLISAHKLNDQGTVLLHYQT